MTLEEAKKLKVGDKIILDTDRCSYPATKGDIFTFKGVSDRIGDDIIIVTHDKTHIIFYKSASGFKKFPTLKPLTLEEALDLRFGDDVVLLSSGSVLQVQKLGNNFTFPTLVSTKKALETLCWITLSNNNSYTIKSLSLPPPKEPTTEEKIEVLRKEINERLDLLKAELKKK